MGSCELTKNKNKGPEEDDKIGNGLRERAATNKTEE